MRPLDFSGRNLLRTVAGLSWPAVTENLFMTTLFVADLAFIGTVGTEAIAGFGISWITLWFAATPFFAFGVAATSHVAQLTGAGDFEGARRAVANGTLAALMVGVVVGTGGAFAAGNVYQAFGTEPQVTHIGVSYLVIVFPFQALRAGIFCLLPSLRGAGEMRASMVSTGAMNVVNIALDALWVTRWGVEGVAWATAVSLLVGFAIALFFARARIGVRLRHLGGGWSHLARMARIALPSFIELLVMRVGVIAMMRVTSYLGTIPLAAYTLTNRIQSIAFMPAFGFSRASATIAGQGVGANRIPEARALVVTTTRLSIWAMLGMTALLLLLAGPLVRLFSAGPGVYEMAVMLVILFALEHPALGIAAPLSGCFQGAGRTVYPLWFTAVGIFGARIPVLLGTVFILDWGVVGIGLSVLADWSTRALLALIVFKRNRFWPRSGAPVRESGDGVASGRPAV